MAAFQPTNDEPDITELLAALRVPVLLPRTAADRELDWVVAPPRLAPLDCGVPRPVGRVVAHAAAVGPLVGVILVPALAVDPDTGVRLGYGGGYYDRLLPRLPAGVVVVGVCRRADLVAVPREPHDIPVQTVLTEDGLAPVAAGAGHGSVGSGAEEVWDGTR